MSGVAPRALLGNYNAFPDQVGNARSEDIVNALEAAYADGFDVANMSLGGSHGKSGNIGFADLPWEPPKLMLATSNRKSTRLNSSHSQISYAVFCLKKKKKK